MTKGEQARLTAWRTSLRSVQTYAAGSPVRRPDAASSPSGPVPIRKSAHFGSAWGLDMSAFASESTSLIHASLSARIALTRPC